MGLSTRREWPTDKETGLKTSETCYGPYSFDTLEVAKDARFIGAI
jgi:hypothetical protein